MSGYPWLEGDFVYAEDLNQLGSLVASATFSFPAMDPYDSVDRVISVPGAQINDPVCVGYPAWVGSYLCMGFVSAPNEVTIRVVNMVREGEQSPQNGTFTVRVLRGNR